MKRPEQGIAAPAKITPAIAAVTISAGEMAHALNVVATKLLDTDIVTSAGFNAISEESRRLRRSPDATSWGMEIGRDNAVVFTDLLNDHGDVITPRISCAGIKVEQAGNDRPPFTAMDISLEVEDSMRNPVSRWHVDWANETNGVVQSGPLVHLQYGGHRPGHRATDHRLKVPRWSHPPMDLLLLCEVVAANFYEEKWEYLRDDASWCAAIAIGQKLCYSAYLRKMSVGMSISSKTLLHSMWASKWAA
jgi:hypothetical protein